MHAFGGRVWVASIAEKMV